MAVLLYSYTIWQLYLNLYSDTTALITLCLNYSFTAKHYYYAAKQIGGYEEPAAVLIIHNKAELTKFFTKLNSENIQTFAHTST